MGRHRFRGFEFRKLYIDTRSIRTFTSRPNHFFLYLECYKVTRTKVLEVQYQLPLGPWLTIITVRSGH